MTEEERIRREKTDKFIEKYLSTADYSKGMSCYGMMADARGTAQKRVASVIKRMPYDEFMKTVYWHLIAYQVKKNSNWKCSISGKEGNLEVHHNNYSGIHGFEMFHLDELICVCHEEHVKIHEEMEAALKDFWRNGYQNS